MDTDTLDVYLYDNIMNKENLNLLLREFDVENFVAFLGAGIGAALKDVPTNEDLYKELRQSHAPNSKERLTGPESFSILYEKCVKKEHFDGEVFETVRPKNTSGPMTTFYIIQAFNCYVTTNYHDPIEDNFDEINKSLKRDGRLNRYFFTFPSLLKQSMKDSITYLHGHSNLGFCILRKKDYEYFYPSLYEKHGGIYALENSLSYLFTNKRVVFLGCSLEDHLKRYLELLDAKIQREKGSGVLKTGEVEVKDHFWIVEESVITAATKGVPAENIKDEEQKFFNRYLRTKIRPIVFKREHRFIEKLCQNLILVKNQKPSLSEQPDASRI